MFAKLFGGNKNKQVVTQPQMDDPSLVLDKLENQCTMIQKRCKVTENKIKEAKVEALSKKKNGDQRGAVLSLKRMKMLEGELTKLDGQQIMLEQQKMTIQAALVDKEVIDSLVSGNKAIGAMNKQMDVDDIAELNDAMREHMDEAEERANIFKEVAEEANDDLLGELEKMEREAVGADIDAMVVPGGRIEEPDQPEAPLVAD